MIPESKGQKAVHACMIRLLNLGPAKHEKVAIYVVNQRISNVCRIAGAASLQSNYSVMIYLKKRSGYGCIPYASTSSRHNQNRYSPSSLLLLFAMVTAAGPLFLSYPKIQKKESFFDCKLL